LRYRYFTFDFTRVTEPGLYRIEHDGRFGNTFRLAEDVYADAWHPTSDVYLPVQMDHVRVQEAYRVWHGRSHLDDARQAPPGHVHFDLYAMGPTTDSSYEPGQHIPGLAIGGWFDAGDFDLRTQTNYGVVNSLVQAWETFRPERDETTVDPERGLVEMHRPDGVPDLLQQIEHGTRYLLAQHRVFGHAIAGVVEPDLRQYPHLGDAAVKTDNLVFDPALRSDEVVAGCSGRPDDRWAFTTRTSALNYGSASALAAASRALRGWRDELATECLEVARQVWEREQAGPPALFAHGNTTGGPLEEEEVKATVELLLATGDARYAKRLEELWPTISQRLVPLAPAAVRAAPKASKAFRDQLRDRAVQFAQQLVEEEGANPFGVQITRGGWAGNARIVEGGIAAFWLHRAFPELVPAEATLRAMNYLLGCHPATNRSFVSAVGARSKDVAYGMNRADFSFIAGGVVPGVLIIEPDFPENKDDWPFLWGQNEYVVDLAAAYLFLALAADDLVRGEE
jgi:endoglucanase